MASFVDQSQKNISIDSSERIHGSATNFAVRVNLPQNNNFSKCSVSYCEFPKSFYLSETGYNTFSLDEAAGGGDQTVTIPVGYYDASSLATALGTALTAASSNGYTYTVSYSSLTNKYTFSHDAGSAEFTITTDTLWEKILGFNNDLSSSSGTATSDNQINLQRYDALYLTASNISNNNDQVLLTLYPSGVADGGIVSYTSPDVMLNAVNVSNRNLNEITFSLRDKNNNVIELNGGNIRFVLNFWSTC